MNFAVGVFFIADFTPASQAFAVPYASLVPTTHPLAAIKLKPNLPQPFSRSKRASGYDANRTVGDPKWRVLRLERLLATPMALDDATKTVRIC